MIVTAVTNLTARAHAEGDSCNRQQADHTRQAAPETGAPPPLGIYVHWPFCSRICPYCDFNVRRDRGVDAVRWRAALLADLERQRATTGPRRLASIYFGGGTPSLMDPETAGAVIAAARRLWDPADDLETTLEANPTDAETARLAAFRAAGVTRLSLGVQAFEDETLRFLGRNHDGAEARRAVETALAVFERVSLDLIYALPGETPAAWRARLGAALAFGAGHLSAYQLTVEPGTAFERAVRRGLWRAPESDAAATLFDATQEVCARAGLPAYEVSNHARPGEESRHNRLYWRQHDYAGVGPGAHGRLTVGGARLATETETEPGAWLGRVERDGWGVVRAEPLSGDDQRTERLAMGLRTVEGAALCEADANDLGARIAPLVGDGLLVHEAGRLTATPDGRRVLNAVLAALLA